MHGFLVSSAGVTCAAALALPLALPTPARAGPAAVTSEPAVPGSTQSLPLVPLAGHRALGSAAPEQGLTRSDVRPFSLVGVVWDDPGRELHGRVQVRTRAVGTGRWSGWQDVDTHNHEHAADPDTPEAASGRVRGSTAPLWVGNSNGVEVRVLADGADGAGRATAPGDSPLPRGLHLELVDPGADPSDAGVPDDSPEAGAAEGGAPAGPGPRADEPGDGALSSASIGARLPAGAAALSTASAAVASAASAAASAANAALAPLGATEIPALSERETAREVFAVSGSEQQAKPYIGPRPRIITRKGWGANESLRERGFVYTKKVKAAFVHHTGSGNKYACSQAPSLIRSIYRYHVVSSGWRDIGYNFVVDKCGNIYEGRAGGVAKPVMGAHTLGFNDDSMGIAVLGSFGKSKPSGAAVTAIARLTAWKLGLFGANPRGTTYLKSGGGNLYRKGKNVRLNVISGHRDGYATECPGKSLYGKLGSARKEAARYQGR
ncbi:MULTISPECIES: peptidoglycan recognition protein family protein [Streptomyces]|uniref:N-acetylmuramoyl-L-alanine amidase n=1 Tax=Streptomyces dengpaensis TaxID=2049881 RepID=A0ABM6SVK0_9ACTN|nr:MULTISPECIES: peptidoglycan recognition protein [Streptomyces]AVH58331.1 N-acetylmuramoyl-L-alanine amidase [Streptomyces dengpaensis]